MSYHVWSVDGYGVCTDNIRGFTTKQLLVLVDRAPEFSKEFRSWAEDIWLT